MSETITHQVSDRICKHMNKDHIDAVLLYAQFFGQAQNATAAIMKAIDATGMDLEAEINGQPTIVRVTFDHPLADAKDAHNTLVDMLKQVKP